VGDFRHCVQLNLLFITVLLLQQHVEHHLPERPVHLVPARPVLRRHDALDLALVQLRDGLAELVQALPAVVHPEVSQPGDRAHVVPVVVRPARRRVRRVRDAVVVEQGELVRVRAPLLLVNGDFV